MLKVREFSHVHSMVDLSSSFFVHVDQAGYSFSLEKWWWPAVTSRDKRWQKVTPGDPNPSIGLSSCSILLNSNRTIEKLKKKMAKIDVFFGLFKETHPYASDNCYGSILNDP